MTLKTYVRYLPLLLRATQVMFCIICLSTAAATVAATRRRPGAVHLAVFASASGLLVSTAMMVVELTTLYPEKRIFSIISSSDGVKRNTKGLLDLISSALLAIFFLSVFAALVPYGTCVTPSSTLTATRPTTRSTARNTRSLDQGQDAMTPGSPFPSSSSSSVLDSPSMTGTDESDYSESDYIDPAIMSDLIDIMASTTPLAGPGATTRVVNDHSGHRRLLRTVAAAAAGGMTSHGHRRQLLQRVNYNLVCSSWNAVVAMGFLSFVAYAVSAVLAVLDMRAGVGLYAPAWMLKKSDLDSSAANLNAAGQTAGADSKAAQTGSAADGATAAGAPAVGEVDSKDVQQQIVQPASKDTAVIVGEVAPQETPAEGTAAGAGGHISTTEFPIDSVGSVAAGH